MVELAVLPKPAILAAPAVPPPAPKRLLTVDQLAEAISMSTRWCRTQLAAGRIRSIQLGRCRRIPVAEVERILSEGL